ncbi:hypothetical protein [Streptomyces fuscichromogenes]|nr:hypothetical protein [Streptomyces fuscichromogenes]
MPKRQSTSAQKARQRQASGEGNYAALLRDEQAVSPTRRFAMFTARGAVWDPITARAERHLAQFWTEAPRPYWEEKFGELCVKAFPWAAAPNAARTVILHAFKEAKATCQTCPSPGRKRVVIGSTEHGCWGVPWVKTCCDNCYWVPRNIFHGQRYQVLVNEYRELVAQYEEPRPAATACCTAITEVISAVRERLVQEGMPGLLTKLEELRESMWSRSAHYDVFSGHGVVLAVEQVCTPLLFPTRKAGVWSEPLLPVEERRQVVRAIDGLMNVLGEVVAEEHSN